MSTTTLIREYNLENTSTTYHIISSSNNNVNKEAIEPITQLLSSPISSYNFDHAPGGIRVRHPKSYSERLKSTKAMYDDLRSDLDALKEREEGRHRMCIDWEIYFRIARALHDVYIKIVPKHAYNQIKAAGHSYLPSFLTAWALQSLEPIPILNDLSEDMMDEIIQKLSSLSVHNAERSAQLVWESVPSDARNLMVTMWLSRSPLCNDIAHPIPTQKQALDIVENHPLLTENEKRVGRVVIPLAVDKSDVPLFSRD